MTWLNKNMQSYTSDITKPAAASLVFPNTSDLLPTAGTDLDPYSVRDPINSSGIQDLRNVGGQASHKEGFMSLVAYDEPIFSSRCGKDENRRFRIPLPSRFYDF